LYKYLILFRHASQLQAVQTHFTTFVFTCGVIFVICFACDFIAVYYKTQFLFKGVSRYEEINLPSGGMLISLRNTSQPETLKC
jgi:hypothetical protein